MSLELPGLDVLLPHRAPMRFVDEIVSADAQKAVTLVHVSDTAMGYVEDKGVPAWMGVEYMAQTVGIVAGIQAMQGEWELTEGYLLGTRRYRSSTPWFAPGSSLSVSGKLELMIDAGIGSFSCAIADARTPELALVECNLTIYRNPPAADVAQEHNS